MRSKAKLLESLAERFYETAYDLDGLFDEVEIDEPIPVEKTADVPVAEPIPTEK